jgi:hypothetical protein
MEYTRTLTEPQSVPCRSAAKPSSCLSVDGILREAMGASAQAVRGWVSTYQTTRHPHTLQWPAYNNKQKELVMRSEPHSTNTTPNRSDASVRLCGYPLTGDASDTTKPATWLANSLALRMDAVH